MFLEESSTWVKRRFLRSGKRASSRGEDRRLAEEVDEEATVAGSDGFWVVTAGSEGGGFIDAVLFNGPSSFFMISYLICFALSIVFASTRAQEKISCVSSSIVVELEA